MIYLKLGDLGGRLLQSSDPSFCLRLPNDRPKAKSKTSANPSTGASNGEWLSAKGKKRKAKPRKNAKRRAPAKSKKQVKSKSSTKNPAEVIDLIDDMSSSDDDVPLPASQTGLKNSILEDSSDDEEFQLEA